MLIWFYFIWNYSKIFVFEGLIRIVVECLWSKVFNMFNGDICVCGWWVYIWFNLYGMVGGYCKRWFDRCWYCFLKKIVFERINCVK